MNKEQLIARIEELEARIERMEWVDFPSTQAEIVEECIIKDGVDMSSQIPWRSTEEPDGWDAYERIREWALARVRELEEENEFLRTRNINLVERMERVLKGRHV